MNESVSEQLNRIDKERLNENTEAIKKLKDKYDESQTTVSNKKH